MDKTRWMAAFDAINTAGVKLADALRVAEEAERSRDFAPVLNGLTVGLSTGTSGRRGVFLVSPQEQRRWAGVMLAKLAPERPLAPRRVAFFLRANSRLYESVQGSRRIDFRFFDLLAPLGESATRLAAFAPHILIAPASVLRLLGEMQESGALAIAPERVISVAEVLHGDDRAAIAAAFKAPVGEVYQAMEGALAMTCELGALHLNEAFVRFEPDWIDEGARRFAPIITDLTRETQPVVRYRLDDVLVMAEEPCPCGRAARTLAAIEGRCDDIIEFLSASGGAVRVFPDFIVRAILGAHAGIRDFRAEQAAPGQLRIALTPQPGEDVQAAVTAALGALANKLGAAAPTLTFTEFARDPAHKRRRVLRLAP